MMIKKMLKYNKLISKALALVMAMSLATSFAFAEEVENTEPTTTPTENQTPEEPKSDKPVDFDNNLDDAQKDILEDILEKNGLKEEDFADIGFVKGEDIKGEDKINDKGTVVVEKEKPTMGEGYDPDEWEYTKSETPIETTITGDKTTHSETNYEYEVIEQKGVKNEDVWDWVEKEVTKTEKVEIKTENLKDNWVPTGKYEQKEETTTIPTNDVDTSKIEVVEKKDTVTDVTNSGYVVLKTGQNGILIWTCRELSETEQAKMLADLKDAGVEGATNGKSVDFTHESMDTLIEKDFGGFDLKKENGKYYVTVDKNGGTSKWVHGSFGTKTETKLVDDLTKPILENKPVGDGTYTTTWEDRVVTTKEKVWSVVDTIEVEYTQKILAIKETTKTWTEQDVQKELLYDWILTKKTTTEGGGGETGGGTDTGTDTDNTPPTQPPVNPPVNPDPTPDPINPVYPPQQPEIDIPDEQPPLAELPEVPYIPSVIDLPDPVVEIVEPEVPMAEEPEIEIVEEEVPLAEEPEVEEEPEFEILDEDVPLADLPQTGSNVSAFFRTLAMIAMAGSLAFAGAAVVLKRKSEEK